MRAIRLGGIRRNRRRTRAGTFKKIWLKAKARAIASGGKFYHVAFSTPPGWMDQFLDYHPSSHDDIVPPLREGYSFGYDPASKDGDVAVIAKVRDKGDGSYEIRLLAVPWHCPSCLQSGTLRFSHTPGTYVVDKARMALLHAHPCPDAKLGHPPANHPSLENL